MTGWKTLLFLAAVAPAALAQQGPAPDAAEGDDPFAAFDDAFDEFDEDFDDAGPRVSGFVEGGYGARLDRDPAFTTRRTLAELRARFETEWAGDALRLTVKGDALHDDYTADSDVQMRELSIAMSPASSVDLKVGRQVLTWGTGDLVFLNDLFPKSWVSFFSGRDDEYLKAPSDAARLTWYNDRLNVDAVWSPRFEPDEYLTGERFSFFSPLAGQVVAPRPPLAARGPGHGFDDGELAVRLFRTVGPTEYAVYLYRGWFKRPLGVDAAFTPTFPALAVFGASLRRPAGPGLINAELAYHDSLDDSSGIDPRVPNSQLRLLVGYEFEARARFTVGLQYYLERTLDYASLMSASMAPAYEPDRNRHLLTNRLTYRGRRERLTLSLFTFYSPSDDDRYLRPSVAYRHSDRWSVTFGANLFRGDRPHTFFGQLEDSSNAWVRVRFSY